MWYFYLINVIENLKCVVTLIQVLGIFAIAATSMFYFMHLYDGNNIKPIKITLLWILIPFYVFITVVNILLPDKETMYLMTGAKATEMLAATPEASKARKVIDLGLDKILVELKKDK